MSLRIGNIAPLMARRNLHATSDEIAGIFRRLASGQRIASASDDPAGLRISESMRARLRSTKAAAGNIRDGISLLRTMEGALVEFSNELVRARELVVSAGGAVNAKDIAGISHQYRVLADGLIQLAKQSNWNGIDYLDWNGIFLQIGPDPDDTLGFVTTGVVVYGNVMRVLNVKAGLDTAAGRQENLDFVDQAIRDISAIRGRYGTLTNRLESALRSTESTIESLTASESRIRDADVALETSALVRHQIRQGLGVAVLAQANVQSELALILLRTRL